MLTQETIDALLARAKERNDVVYPIDNGDGTHSDVFVGVAPAGGLWGRKTAIADYLGTTV